ncbi:MAG: helix-turn-helix transcriptional regulator [Acidimicrobiia bacterium]
MSDPIERVTNLLALLLSTRRPLTLQEIVAELEGQYPEVEGSRRTAFERDKAMLRSTGVPIEQIVLAGDQAGQTAYRVDPARYQIGELGLDDDERRALQLAVATVRMGTDWGEEALWKLDPDSASRPPGGELEALVPSLPLLPSLFEACRERRTVRFAYHDSPRVLDPYALLSRSGFWYLVGFDRDRKQLRTYRVDRIQQDIEAGPAGAFDRPADFDVRTVLPADPKLLGESGGERHPATVLISAERAALVERELGSRAVGDRRSDGSIVVTVPWVNELSFRAWVLGFLEHAEVLGPPAARALVVDWLRTLADDVSRPDAESPRQPALTPLPDDPGSG